MVLFFVGSQLTYNAQKPRVQVPEELTPKQEAWLFKIARRNLGKLRLTGVKSLTSSMGWTSLRKQYGDVVFAPMIGNVNYGASVTEDMTDELECEETTLRKFIDSVRFKQSPKCNYLKWNDDNEDMRSLDLAGGTIEATLSKALAKKGIRIPKVVHWSLWIGGKGSVTAQHTDYQTFNMLHIVSGAKRIVLHHSRFPFPCTEQPKQNPTTCWTGVDVLSKPTPHAIEVVLRAGESMLIPTGCKGCIKSYWHSVENLEPTIAIGINEFGDTDSLDSDDEGSNNEGSDNDEERNKMMKPKADLLRKAVN